MGDINSPPVHWQISYQMKERWRFWALSAIIQWSIWSEPTGAKAVLSFVALALLMEAPLCDSDHRGFSFTSPRGALQAKYTSTIVLHFKKSYTGMRELVKKNLERSAKKNSSKQHGNFWRTPDWKHNTAAYDLLRKAREWLKEASTYEQPSKQVY